MRPLIDRQDDFLCETTEILRAGLSMADWITVDDTGARHRGANAVSTQIGNDDFAWFGTTGSKSRLNFLGLLRGGHTDYVINPASALQVHATRWRTRPTGSRPVGRRRRRSSATLAATPDRGVRAGRQ